MKPNDINRDMIKCSLCGYEFDEKKAESSCKSCAIMKGCRLIKCPNCGFETPPPPKWLKKIIKGREHENNR